MFLANDSLLRSLFWSLLSAVLKHLPLCFLSLSISVKKSSISVSWLPAPLPAVSEKRLALTSQGKVRYKLKTPYRDGTTHVIFEPLDFMAKLAALVPKPRANLTRYHGVLAPNSKRRIFVTPAKRGKGSTQKQGVKADEPALVDGHQSMSWAERLKRVFNIDITICSRCGGAVRIIACIEDPSVIKKILAHLDAKSGTPATVNQIPEPRAPPQESLFD